MVPPTLAGSLSDWTDIDGAQHLLAQALGVMPAHSRMSAGKWVHWSVNPLGDELAVLLDRLVQLGFLEKREEPGLQYRVRADFRDALGIRGVWSESAAGASLQLLVLRCRDLEASKRFYEALGLVFVSEQHGAGPAHYSTTLDDMVLELYPAATPPTPVRLGFSVHDVASAVSAVAALGDFVASFESDNALLRDPDGNKLELTSAGA